MLSTLLVLLLSATPELFHVDHQGLRYSALTTGGVEVIDLSDPSAPRPIGRFAGDRLISRILVQGESLVLLETREDATVWSLADPRTPVRAGPALLPTPSAAPVAAVAPVPTVARAKVERVEGGRIIFDAGEATGFLKGAHVRVLSQRLEQKPDLTTGQLAERPSNEITAVVKIEESQRDKAMARLGRGDFAAPGDLVELTDAALSERLMFPRRSPFLALVGFHLRPFLGLESGTTAGTTRSFGMLIDGVATFYLPTVPIALSLSASPIGFTLGAVDLHYPMTFAGTVAYATDWFEIGIGAGALVGNRGPCLPTCEVNTGFTINQVLRLGALDGLNLSWRSSIFARPDRFVFGLGRAELAVPFTSQLGLFGAGGGGENGWSFGEMGLRTYLNGVGARGTVILSASLGYAAIFDGPAGESVGGPSVAFGTEWRL